MTTKERPLITIGITCFNAQDTIKKAIDSALCQDWPNSEIIIIDDASTDNSVKIIDDIARVNTNIHLYKQTENKGVAAARNHIIEKANGDFIAFFDDDDVSTPDRLSMQYARITHFEKNQKSEAPILCHSARLQQYSDGTQTIIPTAGCDTKIQAPHGKKMVKRLLTGAPCPDGYGAMATCSQMARTSVYKNLNGFDERLRRSEDTELTIRHADKNGSFLGIARPLVIQTMTMSQDKNLNEELSCTLHYMDKHKNLFPSARAYDFQVKWVKAKYDYFKGQKKSLISCLFQHPILTIEKIFWALPSYWHNKKFKKFHEVGF